MAISLSDWLKLSEAVNDLGPITKPAITYREVVNAVCWLVSRGSLLAIGAAIGWGGAMYGQQFAIDIGFYQGCRAVAGAEMCTLAEQTAARINRLLIDPNHPGRSHLHDPEIAMICGELRHSVTDALWVHVGCEE